jgi:hypothetical protein
MAEVQVEQSKDLSTSKGKAALVDIWSAEIENASNYEKNFRKEAQSYINRYKNSNTNSADTAIEGYNVFWSNTQTLRPLVFSNLPNPNITRRFLDKDENSRILSEMMERSLSLFLEESNAVNTFNKSRDDYLIPGRGIVRVIFDPADIVETVEVTVDEDTGDRVEEVIEDEDLDTKRVRPEYVEWDDLRMSTETTWEQVRWISFRHLMTRDELTEKFGSIGKKVDLNYSTADKDTQDKHKDNEIFKRAEVWEVWDKTSERIIWLTLGGNGIVLSDEEDNYNLKGFFPTPKPLGSDFNPTGLTPIPLFRMYISQADELNVLDTRIRALVEQVKFCGVYNSMAENTNIESIMNGEDGEFAPLQGIQPGVKISDQIEWKPIVDLVNVIVALRSQKAEILQNIRDITGLSDIVRGTTVASETATAQRLKGDFAISRIQPLQQEFSIYIRDVQRLLAELIVENYTVEELAKITNLKKVDLQLESKRILQQQADLFDEAVQQLDPNDPQYQEKINQLNEQQQIGYEKSIQPFIDELKGYAATPEQLQQIDALMKDDQLRTFSVDIETDSTVRIDQNQEKADRLEFAQAISTFFAQATPILQVGGMNKTAFNEMLRFISSPFKVGRNLEEYLLDEKPDEPKGPSIEEQMAQADNQRKDQELQLKAQEVNIKQQEVDVKKAQVKQGQIQFEDKLEFEDVNKEADRRAKTLDQVIQDRTQRATAAIENSDLI